MDNNKFDHATIKKICENKLDIKFKKSKEFNGWFLYNGIKVSRITIPKKKKKKGTATGTYGNMAKQLFLNVSDFDKLLNCPLKKNGYNEILKKKGHIEKG